MNGQSFDPFGEPAETTRVAPANATDRRARNVAVALFWSAALLITAGRIHYAEQPVHQIFASLQASIMSVTSIR